MGWILTLGIKVNGERMAVPPSVFEMSPSGARSFIIDSGTDITSITSEAFDALQKKLTQLLGPPNKYLFFKSCKYTKKLGGWRPWKTRPTIRHDFGDDLFEFEMNNVWQKTPYSDNLECLQITRTKSLLSILGDQLLLNVNVGHDPNNEALYLQRTTCPTP